MLINHLCLLTDVQLCKSSCAKELHCLWTANCFAMKVDQHCAHAHTLEGVWIKLPDIKFFQHHCLWFWCKKKNVLSIHASSGQIVQMTENLECLDRPNRTVGVRLRGQKVLGKGVWGWVTLCEQSLTLAPAQCPKSQTQAAVCFPAVVYNIPTDEKHPNKHKCTSFTNASRHAHTCRHTRKHTHRVSVCMYVSCHPLLLFLPPLYHKYTLAALSLSHPPLLSLSACFSHIPLPVSHLPSLSPHHPSLSHTHPLYLPPSQPLSFSHPFLSSPFSLPTTSLSLTHTSTPYISLPLSLFLIPFSLISLLSLPTTPLSLTHTSTPYTSLPLSPCLSHILLPVPSSPFSLSLPPLSFSHTH